MAEHRVGSAVSFLGDGEMSRLELEGKPVVVARVDGKYVAFGGNCPHYGAPLDQGVLKGSTLMCPWHHACFDVRTAVRLEPPALNDLARFPVRLDGGEIVVTLPNDNERQPQGKVDPADGRHVVIIGGGAAGNAAAEELRRQNYAGRITILSSVDTPPVDRPNLSKDYLAGEAQADWIPLRDADWYAKRDIDLRLNTTVTKVNPQAHSVTLEGGETVPYTKLLLAMGAIPRDLKNVPGGDMGGILTLRTLSDADRIIDAAKQGQKVVIIGSSFIGLEAAASLAKNKALHLSVTVVDMVALPFQRVLGDRIGKLFLDEHAANGITFHLSAKLERFIGENGRVNGVQLASGDTLPADFVLIGVGVRPATDVLKDSGLRLNEKDGSVEVDARLRSSDADIYASGDIARYPSRDGESQRIEHWRTAQQHGIVAARALLGKADDVNQRVPFFWTNQFGLTLRYVGHVQQWDEILYRGSVEDRDFIAFYVAGGQLKAAAGMKRDRDLDAVEFILRDRMPLTVEQMRDEAFDLVKYAVQN